LYDVLQSATIYIFCFYRETRQNTKPSGNVALWECFGKKHNKSLGETTDFPPNNRKTGSTLSSITIHRILIGIAGKQEKNETGSCSGLLSGGPLPDTPIATWTGAAPALTTHGDRQHLDDVKKRVVGGEDAIHLSDGVVTVCSYYKARVI